MKKLIIALVFVSVGLVSAKAQFIGLEFGGYGAYWKPSDLDKGYGGGAVVRAQLIEFLGVDARVGYFSFDDPTVDMVPMEVAALLRFPFPLVSPYAGVGGGYYQFSGEKGFSLGDETGWFGTAGLDLTLGDLRVFLEWRYQFLKATVEDSVGNLVNGDDLDFGGNGFSLGVTWFF